jgi:hypothetical protein
MAENTAEKPKKERKGRHPFVCVDSDKFEDGKVTTFVYMNVWEKTGAVRFRVEQFREYTHQRESGTARSFGPDDLDNMVRGIWKAKGWMKARQRRFRLSDLFALFR